jgi:hypothetical protein
VAARACPAGADRVEHHAQPGVAGPGAPHRDRDPAAGSQDPADLGDRPGRVEGEHEAFAAEDDVIGLIGLVEVVEVEVRMRTLSSPSAAARVAAIAVISAATSDRTTSPVGPTSSAAAIPTPPAPQASSSTRSPGRGADSWSSLAVMAAPRVSA